MCEPCTESRRPKADSGERHQAQPTVGIFTANENGFLCLHFVRQVPCGQQTAVRHAAIDLRPTGQVIEAINTLINPTPVVTIHMTKEEQRLQPDTDLTFAGPEDFDERVRQILDLLKTKGILAESLGTRPEFQYSI